jgi:hypothetical protein
MAKKKLVKKAASRKAAKSSENKYLPTLLIVLVSILILMGLLMWRNKMRAEKYGEMQKQATNETQHYQLDTDNDGVYTDAKYGVKFEYPKEIFKYQMDHYTKDNYSSISWDTLPDGTSYLGGIDEGSYMGFFVNEIPINFDLLYSSSIGRQNAVGEISEHRTKKIRNIALNGGIGMVYEVYPEIDEASESTPYYAAWKKGNNTFWLVVSTNDKLKAVQYKKIFDSIVSSFKFTN